MEEKVLIRGSITSERRTQGLDDVPSSIAMLLRRRVGDAASSRAVSGEGA